MRTVDLASDSIIGVHNIHARREKCKQYMIPRLQSRESSNGNYNATAEYVRRLFISRRRLDLFQKYRILFELSYSKSWLPQMRDDNICSF